VARADITMTSKEGEGGTGAPGGTTSFEGAGEGVRLLAVWSTFLVLPVLSRRAYRGRTGAEPGLQYKGGRPIHQYYMVKKYYIIRQEL
jgi:hypothetical protein